MFILHSGQNYSAATPSYLDEVANPTQAELEAAKNNNSLFLKQSVDEH